MRGPIRWLSIILMLAAGQVAAQSTPFENLSVHAVEGFDMLDGKFVSRGSASLLHGGYSMRGDQLRFDREKGLIHFTGNVLLQNERHRFETQFLEFDTLTKTGRTGRLTGSTYGHAMPEFRLSGKNGFALEQKSYHITASRAEIKTNPLGKWRIDLVSPSFTDCDYPVPHHDFRASTATFSQGEKVQMWNMRPRLFRVPYFYLPYAIVDQQYDWPWTSWQIGSKAEWGRFAGVRTHFLPKTLEKRSIFGLDFREERGFAVKQDWNSASEKTRQRFSIHNFSENWKSLSGAGPEIRQERQRVDFYRRQTLRPAWTLTAEAHHLTPRKKYFWSDGTNQQVTSEQFVSPLPGGGGRQERESLFQDYYEDEFRRGRTLENNLALDMQKDKIFLTLATQQAVDQEAPTTLERDLVARGRLIPTPVSKTTLLYSNDFGVTRQGLHFGEELTPRDRFRLFNAFKVADYKIWRVHVVNKVERLFQLGPYLSVVPHVGTRSILYEQTLLTPGQQVWTLQPSDLNSWFEDHRLTSGAVFSNSISGYFNLGERSFKHVLRPSMNLDILSPSTFNKTFLPVRVDDLDSGDDPMFQSIYRIDNQLFSKSLRHGTRMLYSSTAAFLFLSRAADKLRRFGDDLKSSENLTLNHSLYPVSWLRLSSDWHINTFYWEMPQVRNGLSFELEKLHFGWHHVRIRSLRPGTPTLSRHDLDFGWRFLQNSDFEAAVSWDENPRPSSLTALERDGFRSIRMRLGQDFHCLRGELHYLFDFEGSGSTLLLKFGPKLFGENKPSIRRPL